MDTIFDLVEQYGLISYGILFLYCGLKSGSLPLFAGMAAQAGALNIWFVVLLSFAGGYLGDEARFHFARRYGDGWLKKRPKVARFADVAKRLLEQYGSAYIFIYRYPKGLRTVGALPVGLLDIKWTRFTVLNASSAGLWTLILVLGGFYLGQFLENYAKDYYGIFSIALLFAFLGLSYVLWLRLSSNLNHNHTRIS